LRGRDTESKPYGRSAMRVYSIWYQEECRIAVEMERGLLDFTSAYQAYHFLKNRRFMVRVDSMLELLGRGLLQEMTFLTLFDFLETHNLWEHFLITGDFRMAPPIERPPKIIALGRNYAAHAREAGYEPPAEPIFFTKASTAVIGPEEPIRIPPGIGRVDHEIELAVIIGRRARRVPEQEALDYVAGYAILNDVTAREMQRRDTGFKLPWFRAKSLDTFAPFGPCIVTREAISHPLNLRMQLRVNGVVRQEARTSEMIFSLPEIIAYISRWITLEPGDVIATGTPEGVGEIKPGDVVEAEIEEIGVLRNPVESLEE